jgi:hypothetical protein
MRRHVRASGSKGWSGTGASKQDHRSHSGAARPLPPCAMPPSAVTGQTALPLGAQRASASRRRDRPLRRGLVLLAGTRGYSRALAGTQGWAYGFATRTKSSAAIICEQNARAARRTAAKHSPTGPDRFARRDSAEADATAADAKAADATAADATAADATAADATAADATASDAKAADAKAADATAVDATAADATAVDATAASSTTRCDAIQMRLRHCRSRATARTRLAAYIDDSGGVERERDKQPISAARQGSCAAVMRSQAEAMQPSRGSCGAV